jgi:hypothetical protein
MLSLSTHHRNYPRSTCWCLRGWCRGRHTPLCKNEAGLSAVGGASLTPSLRAGATVESPEPRPRIIAGQTGLLHGQDNGDRTV